MGVWDDTELVDLDDECRLLFARGGARDEVDSPMDYGICSAEMGMLSVASGQWSVEKGDHGLRTTDYGPGEGEDQRPEVSGQWSVVGGQESGGQGARGEEQRGKGREQKGENAGRVLTRVLVGLTVLILVCVFISAVNARARFVLEELRFDATELGAMNSLNRRAGGETPALRYVKYG